MRATYLPSISCSQSFVYCILSSSVASYKDNCSNSPVKTKTVFFYDKKNNLQKKEEVLYSPISYKDALNFYWKKTVSTYIYDNKEWKLTKKNEVDSSDAPEYVPQFPGGEKRFISIITKKIKSLDTCRCTGINLYFKIDVNGLIKNIEEPQKGQTCITDYCKREIILAMANMPKWKPAKLFDNPIEYNMSLSLPLKQEK